MHKAYVYVLASQRNGTLYVGSTTNLVQRIWQHKNKVIEGFTAKYDVNKLVYYQEFTSILDAGEKEKKIKNRGRKWKLNLIEQFNPQWLDLYEEICR